MRAWILSAILILQYIIVYGEFHRQWFKDPKTKDTDVSWFWLGWFVMCIIETVGTLILWSLFA